MIGAENVGFPASTCPEMQLWCAVLHKALEDLALPLPPAPEFNETWRTPDSPIRLAWVRETARWQNANAEAISARAFAFGGGNRWRGTVCDFAGVTEECFVKAARVVVDRADAKSATLLRACA